MNLKLPNLPEQDGIGKVSSVIQLICFLVLFIGIYLLLRKVVHAFILRLLILIVDYIVVSLFTYLCIRPLAIHAENAFRKKK
ncbi:MAG: hypothetical protein IKI77_11390 [Oscillospiraceae bacterium]|nr:hypothetical protein [Oscillospiraceae bacterium]